MSQWKSALTLTVAAALVATTAFAQTGASGANSTSPSATPSTSGADKAPGIGGGNNASPSASPSTTGTDKPSSMNSSTPSASPADPATKSNGMKSEKMGKTRGAKMSGSNRGEVKAVQQALKDKGHDPGAVDGVMGPKTRSALKDFQKKEGIKDTGRLDADTRSKLGMEARTSGTDAAPGSASPSTSVPSPTAPSSNAPSASPSSPATDKPGDAKTDSSGATEKK